MKDDTLMILATLLVGIGGFVAGWLFAQRKVLFWRSEWIGLEHDLARRDQRRPRSCDAVEKGEE